MAMDRDHTITTTTSNTSFTTTTMKSPLSTKSFLTASFLLWQQPNHVHVHGHLHPSAFVGHPAAAIRTIDGSRGVVRLSNRLSSSSSSSSFGSAGDKSKAKKRTQKTKKGGNGGRGGVTPSKQKRLSRDDLDDVVRGAYVTIGRSVLPVVSLLHGLSNLLLFRSWISARRTKARPKTFDEK